MVEKEDCMKCCVHFWRILFIILNSVFLLVGLGLIGLAIYLLASQNDLDFLTGSNIGSGSVLILIAGIITAIISFIGVLGAIGMWPVLLIVYIILLFIIVILEIVAGVLGFVFRDDLAMVASERGEQAIQDYRIEDTEGFSSDVNAIVDFLQNRFSCCGYGSSEEWLTTVYFNSTGSYPDSCNCTEEDVSDDMSLLNSTCILAPNQQLIYNSPCNTSFLDFLNDNLIIVGGVGIAFGLFEVIGLGVAIGLTCCFCVIRNNKEDFEFTKAV